MMVIEGLLFCTPVNQWTYKSKTYVWFFTRWRVCFKQEVSISKDKPLPISRLIALWNWNFWNEMCGSRKYPYPPMEGIGISRGVGGLKAQENPEQGGRGGVLYQFILFFPDRFHYSYMLNFLCLHFAYRSVDANIDLVNCTKVIFSRWSGLISGATRVRSFYQTVAD